MSCGLVHTYAVHQESRQHGGACTPFTAEAHSHVVGGGPRPHQPCPAQPQPNPKCHPTHAFKLTIAASPLTHAGMQHTAPPRALASFLPHHTICPRRHNIIPRTLGGPRPTTVSPAMTLQSHPTRHGQLCPKVPGAGVLTGPGCFWTSISRQEPPQHFWLNARDLHPRSIRFGCALVHHPQVRTKHQSKPSTTDGLRVCAACQPSAVPCGLPTCMPLRAPICAQPTAADQLPNPSASALVL